ncbi:MAG: cytochrome b/b6 domain-containing protein [Rhodocyclaceae bacterium]|nr:cytochrome b/b6 domain-containing protein [Rhodocyclaceae bacterium]
MRVRVWDLPLRLFHWLLVAAIVTAFVTAKVGGNAMDWHGRAGLLIIGLLVFRLVWGFIGSFNSRFANFVRGPAAIRAYLQGKWQGAGHNPLGALSVLAMLALFVAQAATGLFANDDVAFEGFLYPLVSAAVSEKITGIHKLLEIAIILLVLAHLGAIAFYTRIRKETLIMPMITGDKEATELPASSPRGGGFIAFIIAAAIGVAAAYAASGALLPPPPPPAAVETPAW